jgi:hypothetical protein
MATSPPEPGLKLIRSNAVDVSARPENYNSSFHTAEEAPDLPIPTETPQSYSRWLPLIATSQRIPSDRIQTLNLTRAQDQLLLDEAQVSLHTRQPSCPHAEDIEEIIIPTLCRLTFPPEGLLRLDASSPKDDVKGTQPLQNVKEIILRLTTSYRAMNAIRDLLGDEAKEIPLDSGLIFPFAGSVLVSRRVQQLF